MIETVPCDSDVTVSTSGLITHRCPYKDEDDYGRILIKWMVNGSTFELHALADYIAAWADTRLSHEQVTERIRHDLSTAEGVTDVRVETWWNTAAMMVSVTAGGESDSLLRKSVRTQGTASHA